MNYIGKIGLFNNYECKAWGQLYGGKECKVIAYDDEITKEGLLVMFSHDSQILVIANDEFEEK